MAMCWQVALQNPSVTLMMEPAWRMRGSNVWAEVHGAACWLFKLSRITLSVCWALQKSSFRCTEDCYVSLCYVSLCYVCTLHKSLWRPNNRPTAT